LDIIDELEEFVPKMIEDAPNIKENALQSKNDPNKKKDPKKNKELLKNYDEVKQRVPKIENLLNEKPEDQTKE